ncbi:hypothetical protein [Pusillimonas sp. ANT_WB101]|uniref:hypothetical protein n=1 Tax=Pusillimonas sp. ANT_WB101 TaxID=2597356 RepID=UPI0011F06AC5|nr:hypothetical protein [Pusillimonas sp. ANT_WB101]KAA0888482.1 hypothetical protein FQ179_21180 [Pusillimonas sp. ANT_WB101]
MPYKHSLMMGDGLKEASELAEVLAAYRRLDDGVTARCASFKVLHLAALVENLRRLHTEAERLKDQLQHRMAAMTP